MKISEKHKIDAPSGTIKKAVSTESGIKGWWCKNSVLSDRVGGTNTLEFVKEGNPVKMVFRIDELTDNKVVWTCTENPNPAWLNTKIIWSWDKDGNTSLDHSNFEEKYAGTPAVASTEMGWKHFSKSLKTYCETGVGEPW